MKNTHHFSSDDKIKWFGYGEWVEEPDEVLFDHEGFTCHIVRVVKPEENGAKFGGHFCGYLKIPEGHPWHGAHYDTDCECHGGISWAGYMKNGEYWIGFDCGHAGDLVPSMDFHRKTIPELKKIQQERDDYLKSFPELALTCLFKESYKNIDYLMGECKSLAEQAKKAADFSLP